MGTSLWLTIPNMDTTGGGLGALHRRDSRNIFCGKSPVWGRFEMFWGCNMLQWFAPMSRKNELELAVFFAWIITVPPSSPNCRPCHSGSTTAQWRGNTDIDSGSQSWWSGHEAGISQHEPCAACNLLPDPVRFFWIRRMLSTKLLLWLKILSFCFAIHFYWMHRHRDTTAGHHERSRRHPVKGWFLESVNGYGANFQSWKTVCDGSHGP